MGKLTALSIKSIKIVGLHADGGGLYLKVQASPDPSQPNKSWIFRWGAGGKNTIGLGPLRDVTLAEARDTAVQHHRLVRQGGDPRVERSKIQSAVAAASDVMTFQRAAEIYIETKRHGWRNAKHADQWTNTITTYANPVIGSLACSDVTTDQVLEILKPIWTTKNETATRLRGRIESIMDWAVVSGHRTGDNPAIWKGKLAHLLPSISKRQRVKHHAAMPYAQIPALFQAIGITPVLSAKALLLCVLTATRTSETIEAKWEEFDFDKAIWTIPKERMKKGREHRVPLSDQAIEVLKSINRIEGSPWVFDSRGKGKPLSNMAMSNYLKGTLGFKEYTVHGFRSSFRDWAGETSRHSREVIEQSLAHSLADQTEAAYQRGDYLEKRRSLMADWSRYCVGYSDIETSNIKHQTSNSKARPLPIP
ncbi:tyrosine-type recombinase/integrase [Limnohabitans sp.]